MLFDKIGKGGFGYVYLCYHKHRICAAKRGKTVEKEYRTLAKLKHKNIVHVFCMKNKSMIMEIYGYDVKTLLKQDPGLITEEYITGTFNQILSALEYCHSHLILHRDIKPGNFFTNFCNPSKVYLGDFGLAKKVSDEFSKECRAAGSLRYMSINVHRGIKYSYRDDLFSLIYSITFLCLGDLPWHLKNKDTVSKKEKHTHFLELKKKHSLSTINKIEYEKIRELMRPYYQYTQCLKFNDKLRYRYLKEVVKV